MPLRAELAMAGQQIDKRQTGLGGGMNKSRWKLQRRIGTDEVSRTAQNNTRGQVRKARSGQVKGKKEGKAG